MCGGLILSLQHHICINCQLCGVKLGVYACVEGEYCHFNITYASTVNYVGSNWGSMRVWRVNIVSHMYQCQLCGVELEVMAVWRVNTVTSTSHMHQTSTMWGQTGGLCVCGG